MAEVPSQPAASPLPACGTPGYWRHPPGFPGIPQAWLAVRGVTYELGATFDALPGPGETAAVTP